MTILGIDPGTRCGWALIRDGRHVASGVWNLRAMRHEGGGMKFLRLRRYLEEALQGVDAVAYEEVRRHLGVDAAHVYGGIVGQIGAVCEERAVPYRGVHWGTAKKHATGKGNADKAAMVAAFCAVVGRDPEDDNEADALFVALVLHGEVG